MSDHTDLRLETTGGTVVCWAAPGFEVRPMGSNDLFTADLPRSESSIVRDLQLITHEVTVQGAFEDSTALPDAHKTDLENLFGTSPVTARDQVRRIWYYFLKEGGPFHFYDGSDSYDAADEASVDIQNGVYPPVSIKEFRPPRTGGHSRFEYTLKFRVGFPR